MSLLNQEQRETLNQAKILNRYAMHSKKNPSESSKTISDLLRIIDSLESKAESEINSLKNGKAIGSLHHKIATLEVELEKLNRSKT